MPAARTLVDLYIEHYFLLNLDKNDKKLYFMAMTLLFITIIVISNKTFR